MFTSSSPTNYSSILLSLSLSKSQIPLSSIHRLLYSLSLNQHFLTHRHCSSFLPHLSRVLTLSLFRITYHNHSLSKIQNSITDITFLSLSEALSLYQITNPMDLALEQLQFLTVTDILKESISIPKQSPKTFYLITLTLIFPLSFAILAHSLFTHPILNQIQNPYSDPTQTRHQWTRLLLFQFFYLLFLFAFSLLSTAAVVFTVASLYTSKPVSFSNTISAIPRVFKRLFITFIWVTILMIGYNFAFIASLVLLIWAIDTQNALLLILSVLTISVLFLFVHIYITALWHLASVVSVLEPVYGLAAMKKSYELLKGRTWMAAVFVFGYIGVCAIIGGVFGAVVVHGGENYGVFVRIVVGGFLVGVLVIVNLVGLLVQSVFYYVCKSFHHQGIDKSALHDHLGGYLGEYVPLKSSVQMESFDI